MRSRYVLLPSVLLGWTALTEPALPSEASFKRVTIDSEGPRNPWVKVVADFDGDGSKDVAIGGSKGPLVWYAHPGWRKRMIVEGGYRAVDGEAGDIDGDGDLDIVMGGVLWYENPGSARIARSDSWKAHRIGSHMAHDLEVGDLDGDGKLDAVTRNQSGFGHKDGNRILLWKQRDPESWSSREIRCPHGEGLALADIDRDGDLDVIIGGRWYEGSRDILEGPWTERIYSRTWDRGDVKVALGDLNVDGRLDVVLSPAEPRGSTYRIAWFEAPRRPQESPWGERTIADAVETVVHALAVSDMTGDGRPDVVAAEMHQGSDPDEVAIYVNGGDGRGWTKQVLSTRGSHNIVLADMEGDGDVDIVGANHGGSYQPIELWESLGGEPGGSARGRPAGK